MRCCLPFGKAGGLQILCCQGFAVNDYNFTLDAWALKPSGFCNVGVKTEIMIMLDIIKHQQWIVIALAFFGILAYIAIVRWRDRQWIDQRFGDRNLRAMSFGVNYFGRATEPGKPRRSSGFLLLLPDGLFYRSRVKKIEVEIPGSRIARVYHDRSHKGVDLHMSLVKIDFLNAQNEKDTAAFKVPYPPQWIHAIENNLLKKGNGSGVQG